MSSQPVWSCPLPALHSLPMFLFLWQGAGITPPIQVHGQGHFTLLYSELNRSILHFKYYPVSTSDIFRFSFDFHLEIEQTQNKSKQPDASLTLNPFPSLGPMSSSYTILQHLPFTKHSKNEEILWKANCRWGVRSGYLPASALLKGRATLHSCIPVSQDNHSILQYSLNDC